MIEWVSIGCFVLYVFLNLWLHQRKDQLLRQALLQYAKSQFRVMWLKDALREIGWTVDEEEDEQALRLTVRPLEGGGE